MLPMNDLIQQLIKMLGECNYWRRCVLQKTDGRTDLVFEVDDDVGHDECLGRQYVLGALGALLEPRVERLVRPASSQQRGTSET